ncbi:MAG: tRNA (cytidine(34)-2'-O)-methyltransferase [Hyphomicrobiaceae bacterium]|nr:tRNA (cytidine(34)-2'-O)-methyltransferase [Hyphomicrobiaceae bacterium]MCC0023300.1 tRNA (cytidine(34)-2'-O)-methyltransferase [Hyphomicrobiaceae bacterium]
MKTLSVDLAIYQPEIPQNTGTMLRTCACFGVPAHIIHPATFAFSEKGFRRAAMDYAHQVEISEHVSFARFREWAKNHDRRVLLLSTKAERSLYDFEFRAGDVLMVGRESAGVALDHAKLCDAMLRIPVRPETRSLNVAVSAAIGLTEALRQIGDLVGIGKSPTQM